jgi:hypothetical protein
MPSPADSFLGLFEESLERDRAPLSRSERRAETAVGVAFALAASTLLVLAGDNGAWHVAPALCSRVAMALAMHARFDVGGGYTPPTQLAFVPLLF